MFGTIITQAMLGITAATLIFAWIKGGPPERSGALWMATLSIAITVFQALTQSSFGVTPIMIADGLMATIFLVLAVRYASLWLAVAMLLQAAAFSMHALVLLEMLPAAGSGYYYLQAINFLNFAVLITICWGTIAAIIRRRENKRPA